MRLYSLFFVTFLHVPHHNKILQYQCYRPIINPLTNVLCRSIIMLHMRTVWDRQGWCTTLKLPRNKVYLHEGAPLSLSSPRLPYHAIIVLSTAYQWMAGAMHCVYDIRGWLGAANAGAWCHNGHDTTVNHTMIIWRCNFLDRDPSMMVHTIDTNGLLPTNEDHSPLPIHVGNKVYMIWRWIGGIDSTLRPK